MTDPLDHPSVAACEAAAHALVESGVSQPSAVTQVVQDTVKAWSEPVPEATRRALAEGPFLVLLVEEVLARAALVRCVQQWLAAGHQEAPGTDISLNGPMARVAAELFHRLGALAGHATELAYRKPSSGLQAMHWRDLTPSELVAFGNDLLQQITTHLMEDSP